MFLLLQIYVHQLKKKCFESDSNEIVSLCFVIIVVVWTMLFFNIDNDFKNYIFILIDLGGNRSSYRHCSDILDHLANEIVCISSIVGKV